MLASFATSPKRFFPHAGKSDIGQIDHNVLKVQKPFGEGHDTRDSVQNENWEKRIKLAEAGG